MRRYLLLPLLSLLLIFSYATAQTPNLNFINLSNKEGLSSNTVNTIFKDKYGYMWFGTEDGLNKYDGADFTVYRNKTGDSASIGGNNILTIVEDLSGNLWVGSDKALSLYDRKKDAFINYYFVQNSPARALVIDSLGEIWVGSYSGLYRFNPKTGSVKHYPADEHTSNQLRSNVIISLFIDSRHRLWVGTNKGLHQYIGERDGFIIYQHSSADSASIADNLIRSITEDVRGTIWMGTNGGLSQLLPDEKSFKNYLQHTDLNTLRCNQIYAVTPDDAGHLWIGTENGLLILDQYTNKIVRITNDLRNKYSLVGKSIRSIFIDTNGIYWIGAYHGGVNKYDKNLAFFNLRHSNSVDPSGLSYPGVTSFVENASGDLYIGTDGGGLNLFNRKTGLFTHPKLTEGNKKGQSILAMERVSDELWVGTFQDGLYVLNTKTGAVRNYSQGPDTKDISGNVIFCIKKDSRGYVWIGTNGDGVNVYNPSTGTFYRFGQTKSANSERLPVNGFIRTIEEDKSGRIWIGSYGAGIAVYNPRSGKFQVYNKGNSRLPSNELLNIHTSQNGEVWVGTSGGGLSLFDSTTSSFTSFSESEGLSNAVIYKILDDDLGRIWVSTNKGISSFDKSNRRFKNYSFHNGLQRSNFSLGAGIRASNGEIFFGGLDGFNYFNPKLLHGNTKVPALVFTDLKISNQSVVPAEDAAIKEHISIAREVRLDYKQNFSLDFVALNYSSPFENRYSYKLEGFDKEWNQVGAAHTAVYTNLDPGEYTFRVKAKSDDGLWSTPEKTIKIYVQPPFWLTIYAYIFYILAAVLVIALIRYRSFRKLKNKFAMEQEQLRLKQMMEEERREAERQREFDRLKIKFLTNLSHEFRTPISLIVGPLEKMLQEEYRQEKHEQLSLVRRNARRLLNLVNQLLDFRKLEENELKLNLVDGDIVACIREVADSFRDLSQHKRINFEFTTTLDRYDTRFDRDKIERILFNLLSNAFKFTGKEGMVTLSLNSEPNALLKITVSDTGVGMHAHEKSKIFDRFFQGDAEADVLNQGSGIGLSITKEFVKLHGGTIEVESEPGNGSAFTVRLPCPPLPTPDTEAALPPVTLSAQPLPVQPVPGEDVAGPDKQAVLLVEDNDEFRAYLKENLQSSFKIIEASNGKEGWQKALSAHPKIIVSDISMPGMDGITLSRKLKSDKRTRHIPIILLTALTGDTNQLNGLRTGASDYLTKPFNFEILLVKIKNLLALNQSFESTYSKQFKISSPEVKVQSQDELLLLNITKYIEDNIDSPDLSVEELARHVYMSRGSLYTKIISLTGETPVEFIRSIKLNKAVALLESSDMKIAEVAYVVGFSTPNYFARAFKAKFNVSPTEYCVLKRGVRNSEL